jgi:hypothetical protein
MTGGTITSTEANGNYLVLDLGRNGATGVFNQSGGTVNMANALQIGVAGGNGTYNLSGNSALTVAETAVTIYLGDGVGGERKRRLACKLRHDRYNALGRLCRCELRFVESPFRRDHRLEQA